MPLFTQQQKTFLARHWRRQLEPLSAKVRAWELKHVDTYLHGYRDFPWKGSFFDGLVGWSGANRTQQHRLTLWTKHHKHVSRQEWMVTNVRRTAGAALRLGKVPATVPTDGSVNPAVVLHLGCGTSALGPWIASLTQGSTVVNADFEQQCIEVSRTRWHPETVKAMIQAQEKHELSGVLPRPNDRILWGVADARSLPKDFIGRFDLVVEKGLLDSMLSGGVRQAALCMEEMAKTVRPAANGGGVVLVFSANEGDRLRELWEAVHSSEPWQVTYHGEVWRESGMFATSFRRPPQPEQAAEPAAEPAAESPAESATDVPKGPPPASV